MAAQACAELLHPLQPVLAERCSAACRPAVQDVLDWSVPRSWINLPLMQPLPREIYKVTRVPGARRRGRGANKMGFSTRCSKTVSRFLDSWGPARLEGHCEYGPALPVGGQMHTNLRRNYSEYTDWFA